MNLNLVNIKKIVVTALLLICVCFTNCKKETSNNATQEILQKIRHSWSVYSSRVCFPDGSSFMLLGDSQYFNIDDFRIRQTKFFNQISRDTSKFQLANNNTQILFYPFNNGIIGTTADTQYINTINDSFFVYCRKDATGFTTFIDSLKRDK